MPDLKALLQDRRSSEAGRIHKHYVCLDMALLEQRDDLLAEAADLPEDDGRMASNTDERRAAITAELEALEARMAEVTVQIVFRSRTYRDYQALVDQSMREVEQSDGTMTRELDADAFFPELARKCFAEFRQHGQPLPDLDASDFASLLDTLPNGEADLLFVELRRLHMGGDDLPKSVKRSAQTQPSASSSKRRTGTGSPRG